MSNSCRVDLHGITAITPPPLSQSFCVWPLKVGSLRSQNRDVWTKYPSRAYLRSWRWMWCQGFTPQVARGWRWIDRQLAINCVYGSCLTRRFVAGRSLWHVKVGHKWAQGTPSNWRSIMTEIPVRSSAMWWTGEDQSLMPRGCELLLFSGICFKGTVLHQVQPGSWWDRFPRIYRYL